MIAPKGTVTHDGSLLPLRHGAARLALEAGVELLVVTHFGGERASPPSCGSGTRRPVTLDFDVVTPWPGEDAEALMGCIAAVMIDRSAQLQATYLQADPDAAWWPPYSSPASPPAVARKNLERYRHSMAEAVANPRERMARFAEQHEVEQRVAQARQRVSGFAE